MSSSKGKVAALDAKTIKAIDLEKLSLEKQLDKVAETLEKKVKGLEKVGDYTLKSVEITADAQVTIGVASVEGSVTLTYSKP
jgi:hypothetical protein